MYQASLQNTQELNTAGSTRLSPVVQKADEHYQNQLHIFANIAQSDNAFVYFFEQNSVHLWGGSKAQKYKKIFANTLNFSAIKQYLHSSQQVVEVLDTPISEVYKPEQYALVIAPIKVEKNQIHAVLGTFLPINEALSDDVLATLGLLSLEFGSRIQLSNTITKRERERAREVQMSELNQDYIYVKDSRHKLVYANQAMLSTFPEKLRPKVVGSNDLSFYEADISAQIIEGELRALQQGEYSNTELLTLANGKQKILSTTKKRFVGSDGNIYVMSVARDVTEKEILINDLKRSNADLDNFAYVASHDLKSPLNVIKRLVTWVCEDCADILPADSQENLSLVLNRVNRMEKLLFDLLSYSRIGKDYQESTEINVKQVVVELLSLIDLPMGFVMNCDDVNISVPSVPFNVVMLNLINNAIKHHDSGNAKIEIKAKRNAKGSVITIVDNGPGIEAKNRERIFKLFETLKPRDEVEGSGMGLSVVKKIVEHYGGHIIVDDNKPRGTKFIVNWPTTNIARSVLSGLHD